MTIHLKAIFLSAALAAMILPVAAQDPAATPGSTVSPTQTPDPPAVQKPSGDQPSAPQVQRHDQQRIGNGVESGQLTSQEAARLERRQARMNKEIQTMRDANGGQLSAADKAKIERQQGRLSKTIYNQKHDAQVQGGNASGGKPDANNPIAAHKETQQDRIAQGVSSGQLTSAEGAKLENQENHINNETQRLRAEQGGNLTDAQKQKIEHQQKAVSKHINRQKHDAQHTRKR